jgi:two-component system sporulation sensor kinase B
LLGTERLLLNILFVVLPIFCFQIFFAERVLKEMGRGYKAIIVLFVSASIVLCMTFPFTLLPGYFYDMRAIPLIVSLLYCGYKIGLWGLIIMLLYRYYLGGDGFYTTLFVYPFVFIVALYVAPCFQRANRKKQNQIAIFLSILSSSLIILGSLLRLQQIDEMKIEFMKFSFEYSLIQITGILITVYFIENMKKGMRMQQEIQRAEKLYAMGELAASVAHEIRNPLTVVRGFIQLFGQQQIPQERQQDYIQIMLTELNRAEEIISDYLTFARPQVEKKEKIEVREQIHQVRGVMASYALLRNVDIHTEVESGLFLTLNKSKFTQCLINLMKNSIEAMPEGGTLTIGAFRRNQKVIIEVIDTGEGMGPEEIKRLGNPFYSTKEKGTGLGLMVCYRIVEAWNGKIEVRSEKGKGTHFSIILPKEES